MNVVWNIHKEEVDNHRQSENCTILNGGDTTPGKPWLYAEATDFFVECEIPDDQLKAKGELI